MIFRSTKDEWRTPDRLYRELDAEFGFADFDPCPIEGDVSGLMLDWLSPCYVNPPYSDIYPWMEKGVLEWRAGKTVVFLVPSRTDTRWWHELAMQATEIRFVRGRLRFGDAKWAAPFPSSIVIFKGVAG